VKLLTVEEVIELWRCRRITILRLMRNHALRWVEGEDGEPLFDRAQILKIKNPRTAGPHLRLVGASETPTRPRPRRGPSIDEVPETRPDPGFLELLQRGDHLTGELQILSEQAQALRAISQLLFEQARNSLEECAELNRWSRREIDRGQALRIGREAPPEHLAR
jgi:hypothetical protein